jgi:hypothetical protein
MVRALAAFLWLLSGTPALAQSASNAASDEWEAQLTLYGWLATNDTTVSFRGETQTVTARPRDLIGNFKGMFMGRAALRKGRLGAFSDIFYVRVGDEVEGTRDLEINGFPLPVEVTADVDLDVRNRILTFAGDYRLIDRPDLKLSAVAGARQLRIRYELDYALSGAILGVPTQELAGDLETALTNWDAIVGAQGSYSFGRERRWFVPFAFNVGGGDSRVTGEALVGVARRFGFGDIVLLYRYVGYDLSGNVTDFALHGPAIGVNFRF